MDSLAVRIATIAVGGACGSVARYLVVAGCGWLFGTRFAYGVLAANLVGCIAMGMVMRGSFNGLLPWSETTRLAVAVGLLGGLTTFSSFGYDTLEYLNQQRLAAAALNVTANVVLGVSGCWLGAGMADLAARLN